MPTRDREFRRGRDEVHDDLCGYLEQPRWHQDQQAAGQQLPAAVAYFSPDRL